MKDFQIPEPTFSEDRAHAGPVWRPGIDWFFSRILAREVARRLPEFPKAAELAQERIEKSLNDLILAPGWQYRLEVIPQDMDGISAAALSVADIVVAKIMAGRPKDLLFISKLVTTGHPDLKNVATLLDTLNSHKAYPLALQRWSQMHPQASALDTFALSNYVRVPFFSQPVPVTRLA
jgi:hypothetical protein